MHLTCIVWHKWFRRHLAVVQSMSRTKYRCFLGGQCHRRAAHLIHWHARYLVGMNWSRCSHLAKISVRSLRVVIGLDLWHIKLFSEVLSIYTYFFDRKTTTNDCSCYSCLRICVNFIKIDREELWASFDLTNAACNFNSLLIRVVTGGTSTSIDVRITDLVQIGRSHVAPLGTINAIVWANLATRSCWERFSLHTQSKRIRCWAVVTLTHA